MTQLESSPPAHPRPQGRSARAALPSPMHSPRRDAAARAEQGEWAALGIPAERRRGRGAETNRSGRYEAEARSSHDDGWGSALELPRLRTEVQVERPKRIITRNNSPDISFDRSINPYRGCEHGCAYCFARPTHAYMGLSPGLDFETRLFAKPDAPALLERELAEPGYVPRTIAIGTNTDPYQPIEREHGIMRGVLEVLARAGHPVGIVTKSALVLRDLDILAPMASRGLVKVALSLTTLDRKLARAMEPRAATPPKRLETMKALADAGVPVTVMTAPVIPALNDMELERLLEAGHAAGAREAGYVLLRLPLEVAPLFKEWLESYCPDRAEHVLSLVRSMRGGKEYDSEWGSRMRGSGPYAWLIGRRFELATKRLGLNTDKRALRTDLFIPPVPVGGQMRLI
jgi:DNA repair photolyase